MFNDNIDIAAVAKYAILGLSLFTLTAAKDYTLKPPPLIVVPSTENLDLGVRKKASKGDVILSGDLYDLEHVTIDSAIEGKPDKPLVGLHAGTRLDERFLSKDLEKRSQIVGRFFCSRPMKDKSKLIDKIRIDGTKVTRYFQQCFVDEGSDGILNHAFIYGRNDNFIKKLTKIPATHYTKHGITKDIDNRKLEIRVSEIWGRLPKVQLNAQIRNIKPDGMKHISWIKDLGYLKDDEVKSVYVYQDTKKAKKYPFTFDKFLDASIIVHSADKRRKTIEYSIDRNFERRLFSVEDPSETIKSRYFKPETE